MSKHGNLHAFTLLRRGKNTFLLFVLLYKLLFATVFTPLGIRLWRLALRFSPTGYFLPNNLNLVLVSPVFLIVGILLLNVYTFWGILEISASVTLADSLWHGRPLRLLPLCREAWKNVKHAFKPENWPLLWYTALIIPFTNLFMTGTFISQLTVPEYIMEVIRDNPLFYFLFILLFLLLVLWTICWFFVYHFFILEHCSLKEAAAKSIALIRGRIIRSVLSVTLQRVVTILLIIINAGVLMGLSSLFYLFFSRHVPHLDSGMRTTAVSLAIPLFSALGSCLESFTLYAALTLLFHNYRSQDGQTDFPGIPSFSTPARLQKSGRAFRAKRRLAGIPHQLIFRVMVIATVVFLFASSIFLASFADGNGIISINHAHDISITSHRGFSAAAPENTLPAFQKAIDTGITDYAELDVQMTKDGVVVVTHDTNLYRCTGSNVNVTDISHVQLRLLDASLGYKKPNAKLFAGTGIPTLEEVIRLCKGKIKLNIEIKGDSPGLERETVRIIEENGFVDDCIISSLRYDALVKVKEYNSSIRCGYILAMGVGNYYDLPCTDFFSVESTFITESMVQAIHEREKQVHAWTVDTEENARRMISLGVDNIITGDPELIYECIHSEKLTVSQLLSLIDPSDQRKEASEPVNTAPDA